MNTHPKRSLSVMARWFAVAAFAALGNVAMAQQPPAENAPPQADPPARVAGVTALEGSVVFAPSGETEWTALPRNRPITKGDRVWTDDGARAELHFGSSVLQMDGRTFVEVVAIDDDVVQLAVNEGSVNARARELRAGDNFEITTPQLALRATQPGDWRLDVDPQQGTTRATSYSGVAVLYGAGGNVQQVVPGQQLAFTGRDLAQVGNVPPAANDGFESWAMDRNRAEDQSVAARYIPRDVVAYPGLDQYGSWSSDPTYGTVWYPQVAVADWAPYRYGHWESIAPWGWTWIDDAPWGFAPFHYGRWAVIGTRWAWVPGPLGRHPVYAPALVAFVGGGPSIGWYPLAPGEVWRPYWNASPAYVRNANRYLVADSRFYNTGTHWFLQHRPDAITTVRVDDFNHGRAVNSRWSHMRAADVARAQPAAPPAPLREARREFPREQARIIQQQGQPLPQRLAPPPQREPRQQFVQPREERRDQRQAQRQEQRAVQAQRVEAFRAQRRESVQPQRAYAAQQQHSATAQRREERAVQRQAQHEERGHGRRYE